MNVKKLGLKLLRAESEAEVAKIVKSDPAMSDGGNWYPLDNRDTNFNVVTNQATTGGKAATELITNMVDAMLMKRCHEEDIDPRGKDAPSTMYEAVDKFVENMNGGRLIDVDNEKFLRVYARENLVIGVTANNTRSTPCYTFADNGEGQHPKDFSRTFLSFGTKNKSEIPFVQGKYNMGSSGVLNFCGDKWFKLILSRRFDKSGKWGWTIVRRHEGDGMGFAEYFAPRKQIPTLENLDELHPFQTMGRQEFEFKLGSGTVVKLYDFHVGQVSSGFREAREAFIENLVETILPFRLYDFRQTPTPARRGSRAMGIDERPFYGMEYLLCASYGDTAVVDDEEEREQASFEKVRHIGTLNHPRLGKIVVNAVPIKQKTKQEGSRKKKSENWYNKSNNRIFHHVNGQVLFKWKRGALTQWKLSALKDNVAIFVDASGLKDSVHQRVWKGDREHIVNTQIGEEYKNEVKNLISQSDFLKKLNHRIAREEMENVVKEGPSRLLQNLVKQDKNLLLLLNNLYPDVAVPQGPVTPEEPIDLTGEYHPTYIKVKGNRDIELPINKTRPIPCDTDVIRNYFIRTDNQGSVHFEDEETANSFSYNPNFDAAGNLVIFFRPDNERMRVGDVREFKIGLKDEAMPEAVYSEQTVRIKIVAKVTSPSNPQPKPQPSAKGLPPYRLLTKDGRQVSGEHTVAWGDFKISGFGGKDGGIVSDLGEENKIYYINFDNVWFQNHLQAQKQDAKKIAAIEKYIQGMRIALLGLESALADGKSDADDQFDADKFRRLAAKGVATVIMTLCDHLPNSFILEDDADDAE